MNIKHYTDTKQLKQTLTVGIVLIILVMVGSMGFGVYIFSEQKVKEVNGQFHKSLHDTFDHVIKHNITDISYLGKVISDDKKVIELLKEQKRDELYEYTLPIWNRYKGRNEYLETMCFHNSDGTSFLRMHAPEFFGDSIENIRPMVRLIHTNHKEINGYETGKHALVYRVILPIFSDKKYIGALDIGINTNLFIKKMKDIIDEEALFFVQKSRLKLFHKDINFEHNGFALQSIATPQLMEMLKLLPKNFNFQDDYPFKFEGKKYYIHTKKLINSSGEYAANLIMFKEVKTDTAGEWIMHTLIIAILLFTAGGVVFLFLKRGLEKLEENIETQHEDNLNKLYTLNKELDELKQRYEYAISGTNDGLYDWNIERNEIYFSPRFKEQLGYSDKELKNEPSEWEGRIHPDDIQRVKTKLQEHLNKQTQYFDEVFRMRHKEGHWVWIESKGKVVAFDKANRALRMVGVHIDITENKMLQNGLIHVKKILEEAQKIAHIGSWENSIKGNIVRVNEEFIRIYRITDKQLINSENSRRNEIRFEDFIKIVHPYDRKIIHNELLTQKNEKSFTIEFRVLFENGEIKYIRSKGVKKFDDDGTLVKISGVDQDITDLKIAYNEMQKAKEALEEAQKIAHIGNWEVNIKTRELAGSLETYELFGYNDYPEIHTFDEFLSTIHPDDLEEVQEAFINSLQDGSPYTIVHRVIRKDNGAVRYLEGRCMYIKNEKGELIKLVGTMQDITERKELEAELKHQEELMIAQSRQAAMGDMIAMIAHQWRQRITVVAMAVNNLKIDMELGQKITTQQLQQMGDEILVQTQHLSQTIDDFRNFFKPNKEKESVSVAKVMDGVIGMIGKSLENNNIAIDISADCKNEILTFSNELLQVFLNILNNAKDALKDSKAGDARIVVRISEDNEFITTTICDNGGGIPENILLHLGEPYVSSKVTSGTGLGIYMSKIIIEKHLLGTLEWENMNGGACFIIKLPLKSKKEQL